MVSLERYIEELTLNAWPAAKSLLYDGWILCFSGGYTRRANSIHPLYVSTMPVSEKIAVCEATYAARGMDTVFKVTSSGHSADLDRTLERHGYEAVALTSVQTADLSATLSDLDNAVVMSTTLEDTWFADFNRLTVVPEHLQVSERRLLERIVPAHTFASLALEGQTVALGMAIAERAHVGLFDIIVDSRCRNRGLARSLCTSLLNWGRDQGAEHAYLAVMADNAPAQKLYANLGFREAYQYWYRHRRTAT